VTSATSAVASASVTWEELNAVPAGSHFTIVTLERRLAWLTADPWAGYKAAAWTLPTLQRGTK
jgi:bifunctional non-homologous end joining protein LigD